jgi:hypothetical protein
MNGDWDKPRLGNSRNIDNHSFFKKRGNPVFVKCNSNNDSIIFYVETAGTLRMEEEGAFGTWVFSNRQGVIFQEI